MEESNGIRVNAQQQSASVSVRTSPSHASAGCTVSLLVYTATLQTLISKLKPLVARLGLLAVTSSWTPNELIDNQMRVKPFHSDKDEPFLLSEIVGLILTFLCCEL